MNTVYNEVMTDVKLKLELSWNEAIVLSVSTDGWTSRNNESYIAVTAHFLDKNTKFCPVLLTCKTYDDTDSAENLFNFIRNAMAEWNISYKVTAVVSDNTANTIAAVRLGEWRSIGCFAHLLNLVVQNATKEYQTL